jgi:hypothetical protein
MPGSRRLADHPACNGPARTQPFIVSGGCSRPKPLCGDPAILGPTLVAPNLAGEAGSLELGEGATSIFDYPHAHRRSRPRGSKGPVRRRTTRTFSGHHPEFFGKPRKQEARGSSGPDALERWFRSSALRATSCMLHRKTLPPDERIAVQLIARARRPAGRRRILRIGIAARGGRVGFAPAFDRTRPPRGYRCKGNASRRSGPARNRSHPGSQASARRRHAM